MSATLKIRYGGEGYRWYPGVRRIQCGPVWQVADAADPSKGGPEVGGVVQSGAFDSTQPQACLLHVQLGQGSDYDDNEVQVIVPVGDSWLMGDDGRTIDRIP